MKEPAGGLWNSRVIQRRVAKKGLRPRLAASIIAFFWLVAIVVFGIAEHLIDPTTFDNAWSGMWWATQTVTTVGYGDIVPADTAGRLLASVLMIGGLSLFAVITGVITSSFVAWAQADRRDKADEPVLAKLAEIESQMATIRTELAQLSGRRGDDPSPRA